MNNPAKFILSTDFATLKNDASASISITVPGSFTVSGSTVWSSSQDITLGQTAASIRGRVRSSKNPLLYLNNSAVSYARNGSDSFGPVIYDLLATITRVNPTTLRLTVSIRSPYGTNMTTESGAETITFWVSTFLSPFTT